MILQIPDSSRPSLYWWLIKNAQADSMIAETSKKILKTLFFETDPMLIDEAKKIIVNYDIHAWVRYLDKDRRVTLSDITKFTSFSMGFYEEYPWAKNVKERN